MLKPILISNTKDLKDLEVIKSAINKNKNIPITNISVIRVLIKKYMEGV